jgi:radical SAM protein with 4Fe4S-binding SPASM domain
MQATVTNLNKGDIADFAKHFDNKVNFQPLYPKGRGKSCKELSITGKEYFNALNGAGIFPFKNTIHGYRRNPCKRCSMGIGEVSISPSGDLYPCHMLHYPQFLVGNLISDNFKELYYDSDLLKKIRNINVDTIKKCSKCDVRNFCAGACRARLDFQKGGLEGEDEFCIYEKETILDALMYSFG